MKQLFICEKHHHVLYPWSIIKRQSKKQNLLTFDNHTDTAPAFCRYLYRNKAEKLDSLISRIKVDDIKSIFDAIRKLNNDEHVDTAIKCGIINKAFVISHDGSFDKPSSYEFETMCNDIDYLMCKKPLPKVQTYPDSNIYIVGTSGYLDDDNCISDSFLSHMLEKIQNMYHISIMKSNYIFDVDLDYFHTYESLKQNDNEYFKHLLSQATAITIATEPDFVKEEISSDLLLEILLDLSKQVCGNDLEIVDLREKLKII